MGSSGAFLAGPRPHCRWQAGMGDSTSQAGSENVPSAGEGCADVLGEASGVGGDRKARTSAAADKGPDWAATAHRAGPWASHGHAASRQVFGACH